MSDTDRSRLLGPLGAAVALALAGLLIWAVQSIPDAPGRGAPGSTPLVRLTDRLVILHGVAVLAPAPPSAQPALTFEEAFARYAASNGAHGVTHPLVPGRAYLGMLFVGNGRRYRVRNVLAYAFVSRGPCRDIIPGGASPPPARPCEHWIFIDATNGQGYDQLQVPVAGS